MGKMVGVFFLCIFEKNFFFSSFYLFAFIPHLVLLLFWANNSFICNDFYTSRKGYMRKFNTWCFHIQEIHFLVNMLTTAVIGNACVVQELIQGTSTNKPLLFNRLQSLGRKCVLVLICSMLQQFRATTCHQQRFQLYHSSGSYSIPLSAMTHSTFF